MASKGSIPWRVPATMLASWVVALVVALSHHFFYAALNNHEVPSKAVEIATWTLEPQQVNIATGTALAFIFKAALTIASSMSYVQLFFSTVSTTKCSLKRADDLFSASKDITSFFQITPHYKYWLLTSTALVVWLIPFAAVLPPASLTVVFTELPSRPPKFGHVVQAAFDSFSFWQMLLANASSEEHTVTWTAWRPFVDASRIAMAAATAGSILPIPSPGVNASWDIITGLPRAICSDLGSEDPDYALIKRNILTTVLIGTDESGGGVSSSFDQQLNGTSFLQMFSYLSWIHGVGTSVQPFFPTSDSTVMLGANESAWGSAVPDLYVLTNNMTNIADDFNTTFEAAFHNAQLLRCSFEAANYSLRYTYNGTDQAQFIEVMSVDSVDGDDLSVPFPDYQVLMPEGVSGPTAGSNSSSWAFSKILRNYSYHSVLQSFATLLIGANNALGTLIGEARLPNTNSSGPGLRSPEDYLQYSTNVFMTSLRETIELVALVPTQSTFGSTTFPNMSQAETDIFEALVPQPADLQISRKPLKSAIEELLFNVSISMANSPMLRYNPASPFAPPEVPIVYNLWGNMYTYTPAKLWLPYGLALGASLLNVIVGLSVICVTGATFSSSFSTIFRFAKNSTIGVETHEPHLPGRDPLPPALSKATLSNAHHVKTTVEEEHILCVVRPKSPSDGDSTASLALNVPDHLSEQDVESEVPPWAVDNIDHKPEGRSRHSTATW